MRIEMATFQEWASTCLPVLVDAAVKGAVLLAAASVAASAMRRRSAAARHTVWVLALAALPAMPFVARGFPSWQVLPSWAELEMPARPGRPVEIDAPTPAAGASAEPGQAPLTSVAPPVEPPRAKASAAPRRASDAPKEEFRWTTLLPWALLLWVLGTIACLLRPALGRVSLWRLARAARRIDSGSWAALVRRAAEAVGLRRHVTLLQSDAEPMPMVWGIWRPKLLLPAEAESWSPERRWVVLLHELAHAKRRDCLTKLIAQAACAAYWFNPLCWWASKQMQHEAEAACDDLVLASGHRPSDYATHLLEIVSGLKAGMLAAYSSIAMADRSKLEGRLLAILDGGRNRRAFTRLGMFVAAILVVGLAVLLSVLDAAGPNKPAETPNEAATRPATRPVDEAGRAVSVRQAAGEFLQALARNDVTWALQWTTGAARGFLGPVDAARLPEGVPCGYARNVLEQQFTEIRSKYGSAMHRLLQIQHVRVSGRYAAVSPGAPLRGARPLLVLEQTHAGWRVADIDTSSFSELSFPQLDSRLRLAARWAEKKGRALPGIQPVGPWRTLTVPHVDTPNAAGVILDLARGKLISPPVDLKDSDDPFGQMTCGDLLIDGRLGVIRGGWLSRDGQRIPPRAKVQSASAYDLADLGRHFHLNTSSGRRFEIEVVGMASDGSLTIRYRYVGQAQRPASSPVPAPRAGVKTVP